MKYTRENVQERFARGMDPVQVDGIPEGFSFKGHDMIIGKVVVWGKYKAFVPMTDVVIVADTVEELQDLYTKQKNGQRQGN